jgi:hypothetical protein
MISIQQRVYHLSCLGERMVRLSGGLGSLMRNPYATCHGSKSMVTMESISQSLYALARVDIENIGFGCRNMYT